LAITACRAKKNRRCNVMVEMIMRPTEIKLCTKIMKRMSYLQVGDLKIMNVRNSRLASTRAGNKPILVRQVPATQYWIRRFSPPCFVFPSGSAGCSCNLFAPWGRSLILWTESAIRGRGLSSQKSDDSWHCKEETEKRHARRA
jgi:hypothetical protein